MKGIVEQAANKSYWDIWNQQKLNPELETKRQKILDANRVSDISVWKIGFSWSFVNSSLNSVCSLFQSEFDKSDHRAGAASECS